MPFLKFSRDRRGYEHFSIVEPSAGRRGKTSRPRVLFWFRTPPQVKVGREPFTDEIRRAIEVQNPGLKFDWVRLMATPFPPPDAEHWRERRRAEKAARQAMRESVGQEGQDIGQAGQAQQAGQARKDDVGAEEVDDNVPDDSDDDPIPAEMTLQASESQEQMPAMVPVSGNEPPGAGRRRRRRGRRRHQQTVQSASGTAVPSSEPVAPNVPVPPTEEV